MDFTIEDIEKQFEQQLEKVKEIDDNIRKSYEERIKINDITSFFQQKQMQDYSLEKCKDELETEIEKCNKQISTVESYNFGGLKQDKKLAIEKLKELKEYKKYLDEDGKDVEDLEQLISRIKIKKINNVKNTNKFFMQKNEVISVIRNLKDVCKETISDLEFENGKSVDLSKLFAQYESIRNEIKSYDKYNNILSRNNKMKLEQLKAGEKKIIELLGSRLPDPTKEMRESIEQEMYEEERKKVSEKIKYNNNMIEGLKIAYKGLNNFENGLWKNQFLDLTLKIHEQEKEIIRIKMNIAEDENKKQYTGDDLSKVEKERIEKILNDPKDKIEIKKSKDYDIYESNNIERMNVKDITNYKDSLDNNQDTTVLSQETIAEMDKVLNKLNNDESKKDQEQSTNFEEVFNKIKNKQKEKQNEEETEKTNNENQENIKEQKPKEIIQIKHKRQLENIKKYLEKTNNESDEIEKKVKRKTSKGVFNKIAHKALDWIVNFFTEPDLNALIAQEEIKYEKKHGRSI